MERMLAVMADNPAAAVAGFIAMVCFATWPLFRARWTMLMAYIGNNLGFVVHYTLLGDWTGSLPGLVADGLSMAIGAVMLLRRSR